VLRPGGYLALRLPRERPPDTVRRALLFAGFTDIRTVLDTDTNSSTVEVVSQRPPWAAGAAAPLSFALKRKAAAATASSSTVIKTEIKADGASRWRLAATDLTDDGIGANVSELEDEDALLARETLKVEVKKVTAKMDCGTGPIATRKACKNCSCGLAALQAAEEKSTTTTPSPTPSRPALPVSSCGSCGLGDAFRCSTCPYLGQPAFKQGDVVKLQL